MNPFVLQLRSWFLALFVISYLASCSSKNNPADPQPTANQYLVSSTLVAELSKDQLATQIAAIEPTYALLVQQGIKARRLVYKTTNWDGSEIQASGLLLIPNTTSAIPMISQQHGTIFSDASAPSYFNTGSEAYQFASIFASAGYIIACPDYIGYGASNNVPHTYEQRASLAQATLDMLRAAREYINSDKSVNWDKRLFMAGYSEGGYATMSTYKKMQDEVPTEFNLRGVSCGAGAYDKTDFMKALLTQTSSGGVNVNRAFLWVLLTYDKIYKLNRSLSTYFKEPYLTDIANNGLNATINVSFDQIFTDSFKQGVTDGTDTAFLNAVADNNVYDWKPLTPLRMYHGDADQQVFFLNSQNAYDAMIKRGADPTIVKLYRLAGKTHETGIPDWLLGTYSMVTTTP